MRTVGDYDVFLESLAKDARAIDTTTYKVLYEQCKFLYDELIGAVGNKYPNESRHQTALRYILTAEQQSNSPAQQAKEMV